MNEIHKKEKSLFKVETIAQLHEIAGLDQPRHPLVSIIDYSKIDTSGAPQSGSFICNFYSINYKKYCSFIYGRQPFDHQEGTLHCTAPGQILSYTKDSDPETKDKVGGWGLFFHPDLIHNTSLGEKIHEYTFFSYAENEALHLSEEEKQTLLSLLVQMEKEYNTNMDHYSHSLIVSNIELILNYCLRYYGRQFITRRNYHQDKIIEFEKFLTNYIYSDQLKKNGIPSVKYCAENMNLSPNYFSDLLKNETGKNTQEHIHFHILEKAKNLLRNTNKTLNEIAYELGFEYPQYLSKLFKKKTGMTPRMFRIG